MKLNQIIMYAAILILGICSCTKEEKDPVLTQFQVNPESLELEIGESATLSVIVNPQNAVYEEIIWSSEHPDIASVSPEGEVLALSGGKTTITAEIEGKKAYCNVTVADNSISISGITIEPETLELEIGEEHLLKATVEYDGTEEMTIAWSSSDESVATVDETGLVSAISEGTASITASCGDKSAKCTVTVKAEEKPFTITINEVTALTVNLTVTPPNEEMTYYTFFMEKSIYDQIGGKSGIFSSDREWWSFISGETGMSWIEYMNTELVTGTMKIGYEKLTSEAEHVAYAYGIDTEGNRTTDIYVEYFTTEAQGSQRSDNEFTVTIYETYYNGLDADIVTTNDDTYFLTAQSSEFVSKYEGRMEEMMYKLIDVLGTEKLRSGNLTLNTTNFSVGSADTDYYLILFGCDNRYGITTDVTLVPFRTKPRGSSMQKVTIEEFKNKEEGTYYQITATITDLTNPSYGYVTVEDETGSLLVLGMSSAKSDSYDWKFESLGLEVGDIVTFAAKKSNFGGDITTEGAYYISHK